MNNIVRNPFLHTAILAHATPSSTVRGSFFSWLRLSKAVRFRREVAFLIIFTSILCGSVMKSQAQNNAPVKKQQSPLQAPNAATNIAPVVAAPANNAQQISTPTQTNTARKNVTQANAVNALSATQPATVNQPVRQANMAAQNEAPKVAPAPTTQQKADVKQSEQARTETLKPDQSAATNRQTTHETPDLPAATNATLSPGPVPHN